jgi:hypothetical protein
MIAPDEVNLNAQTTSEMAPEATASEKDISENPQQQQQQPEPKTSSPQQQPSSPTPTVPEPTVPEQTVSKPDVPEPTVSEQTVSKPVPEPTKSLTVSLPDQTIQITRFDGISLATNMDTDSEDDQDDHASAMAIDPDQPSTSNSLTTNGQTTSSQAIVPIAPPKPSKQPSPPTIFLDSHVLQGVWQDITSEVHRLIESRSDLGHKISYQKQWRRIKERVINLISTLHDSCLQDQEEAKQKLDEDMEDIEVLGTWVKHPMSIRGREPEDFLPNYIHPKDLDLTFLSKINLKNVAPDLALVQENKVLKKRNRELEQKLQE